MSDASPVQPLSATTGSETVALAGALASMEGYNATLSEDVTVARVSEPIPRVPILFEPCLVFVVQVTKRGFVGHQKFVYNAKTMLVMSAPVPFQVITEPPDHGPLLAVYVRLRRETIIELMAGIRQMPFVVKQQPRAFEATKLEPEVADALTRLLRALCSSDDARVLGKSLVRELTYRVLMGRKGISLRALVASNGHFAQLCHTLQHIHDEYHRSLNVSQLARASGMSESVFYLHFKQVTSTSPAQYIKAVRLHNARSLMLQSNLSAAAAATQVGYKSASQFGRDFKRFFGVSPGQAVEKFSGGTKSPGC